MRNSRYTLAVISASCLLVAFLALSADSVAHSRTNNKGSGEGRSPAFTPYPALPSGTSTPPPGNPTPRPGSRPTKGNPQFMPVSSFGMNLYLTGLERSDAEATTLGTLAAQGGVKWAREELSWANIEPTTKGQFSWGTYDRRLALDTTNGIDVVGMLLTTPRWSSTNPNASNWYWYEPSNFNDYFDFVRAAVNRWKSSIHVWEIWNEPNHTGTWNCVNNCNRAGDYARLLQGAYVAVKSVDPNARVLIGGLYIHDTNNEGMSFLDQVVAASGGAVNFDGLSVHTYMPDRIPEATRPDSIVQNFQYRLNMANNWINAHNGVPAEIWVTEDGRSTCTTCAYRWSDDDQASMLARMYGIALASPRVVQFDWFQFEDKFNNPADLYGGMSTVHDNYTTKPAYTAYKTAQNMLDGSVFTGFGPQMIPGGNPNQPDDSDYAGFDYRFVRGALPLHMLWRPNNTVTFNYPVETAQVDLIDRDGGTTRLTATNGTVRLSVGPRPQYVLGVSCGARFADVCPDNWAYTYIEYMAQHGIISGYADGTFRPNNTATRAQLSKMTVTALGWPLVTPASPTFRDVPATNPFYSYIETAKSHGVISGYSCGANCFDFRPNNNVTRGQTCKIIVTAFAWPINTAGGPHFTDVPATDPFYNYVETAFNRAIVSGYGTTFRPGNSITRAQVSKMLYLSLTQ
ncbi:MAG: S-layer homology domain-containing protein [Chloroflexia bacterium]